MELEEWDEACRQKFVKAKEECSVKMESWPIATKLKETMRQWLNAIRIDLSIANHKSPKRQILVLHFPTASVMDMDMRSREFNFNFNFNPSQIFRVQITSPRFGVSTASNTTTETVFIDYGKIYNTVSTISTLQFHNCREVIGLQEVPINLHGGLIFYLVAALGGRFNNYQYHNNDCGVREDVRYSNSLHFHKQHLFPGSSEHLAKLFPTFPKDEKDDTKIVNSFWIDCQLDYVVAGDNLLFEPNYRNALIDKLCEYQANCLVNYFFRCRNNSSKLEAARKFLTRLRFYHYGEKCRVEFHHQVIFTTLVEVTGKTLKEKLNFTINSLATDQNTTSCTSSWATASKDEIIIAATCQLTIEEIDWILHAFIEVYSDGQELEKLLFESASLNTFPILEDHFESFDPQLLRGLLAETKVSHKLAIHSRNILSLRQDINKSTSPIPLAVMDLMESYLSLSLE